MTTERLREPRRAAGAMDTPSDTGDGNGQAPGARAGRRPATVTVMPLWARPGAGARG
ncbi:hypothetical protein [Streptomyces sp. NPDC057438]|uniref:hypothetical protein n=1 Tax=Streptomyces sp. NPDC057438 TaxID=3346133 RepID=UPI003685AB6F